MFCFLLLIALVVPMDVTDCSFGIGSVFVSSVDFEPDPPVHGQSVTASASFNVTQPIDTLQCQVAVRKYFFTLYHTDVDVCEAVSCPLSPGIYNKTISFPVPSFTPSGSYGLVVHCKDKDGFENACAKANVKIQ